MKPNIRSFCIFALALLNATAYAHLAADQRGRQHHQHGHFMVGRRYVKQPAITESPTETQVSTTMASGILTYITPSPGASVVTVTQQSEIVTSYVPLFTLCELPPIARNPISPATTSGATTVTSPNYSISIPTDLGTCTTIFEPTITMVCATTLTALDRRITVTNCYEDLTFSTEYGYVLATPTSALPENSSVENTAIITPGPSIETLTTYYLAPWQQLTAGTAPSEVDLKVCRTFTNGSAECIREYQVWETSLVTRTATTVTSINISTTIHGSSQLIVETFVANVTEYLTTFSMSTTMDLEFQTEYTTTNSANRTAPPGIATSTAPGLYHTYTLERVSGSTPHSSLGNSGVTPPTSQVSAASIIGEVSASNAPKNEHITTTIHITSTIVGGTSTVTVQPKWTSPALVAPSSVDFASMLGVS